MTKYFAANLTAWIKAWRLLILTGLTALATLFTNTSFAANCGFNLPYSTWLSYQSYSSSCPGGGRVEHWICESNAMVRVNGEVGADYLIHNNTRYDFTTSKTSMGNMYCEKGTGQLSPFSQPAAGTVPLHYAGLVNMGPANRAPTVANGTLSLAEDGTGSITLTASDADAGDSHTFNIVSAPGKGSASMSGSRLNYIPPANWNGTTTLTYRATDSKGAASNTATITITVTPVNDAPSVGNRVLTMNEDTVGTLAMTVTDIDLSYEGDSHTWEIVAGPDASNGVAVITGGTLTFTPVANWSGTATLTYRARDSKGAYSNTASITITVNPVNDAPVADPKSLTTPEDTAASVTLSASDIDSPAPTVFQVVTAPNAAHGTASISGSTLTFTPAANWNGSTSLTYRAQDNAGAWSAPVTIAITVTPVNDAPSVVNRTLTTDEDTSATLTLTVNDVDLSFEGDSHVWSIVTAPNAAHGAATITGTTLRFTPAPDWNGTSTLTYRATDSKGVASNTATVTITVVPVNDAPIAIAKTLSTDEDTVGTVSLSATDIDSPAPTVFEIVTAPATASGTATITGNTLTFSPAANWNGTATLTYRAQDSSGAWSAPVSVTINVAPVNDVPALKNPITITTHENKPATIETQIQR